VDNARKQIGQLLVVGFDETVISARLRRMLTHIQPAGVILFARNIEEARQTWELLRGCRLSVATPLFTCVDMEGGLVDRLRNVIEPAPSAADVFATSDRSLFRKHGKLIGESCRMLGFNTDLAPVVDLAFPASRTVMESRSVSDDPAKVVVYAREFLRGLRSSGVLGAVKHFPGLGEGKLDSHHELPVIAKSWKKLWEQDIYPYRILRREVPMVLVGHAAYPSVTRVRVPASLSGKWISGILRSKVGYHGLAVSDDMEMGGVLKAGPIEHAAVEFIRAGGDLCLICHKEEAIAKEYEALVREVERDRRFRTRVLESVRRISALKIKSAEIRRRTPAPTAARLARMKRQMWEFGEEVRFGAIQGAAAEVRQSR
jgi:beta-N-acetylhexosaminidase